MNSIEDVVHKIVKDEFDIELPAEWLDTPISEVGLDSLDTMELIISVEEKYNTSIDIDENKLTDSTTFKELINFIREAM